MRPEAPHYLGLALIAAGTFSVPVSTWQYHTLVDYLWSDTYKAITTDRNTTTPAMTISIVMIFIGLFALFAVLIRVV